MKTKELKRTLEQLFGEFEGRVRRLEKARKELEAFPLPPEMEGERKELLSQMNDPTRVEAGERAVAGLRERAGEYYRRQQAVARAAPPPAVQPSGAPEVVLELTGKSFPLHQWTPAEIGIVNRGKASARGIIIQFPGEIEVRGLAEVPYLEAGSRETRRIELRALEKGERRVEVQIVYRDASGRERQKRQALSFAVQERYVIASKIGSGAFADVYQAQRWDGTIVAVKLPRLDPYQTFTPAAFLKEAELWSKLHHPCIVAAYDYGEKLSSQFPGPWIALEYMEGSSLRERLKRPGRLPREEALAIAVKLTEALNYAHDRGVIHRDIKPENILFDRGSTPKLTDWGLGKIMLEVSGSLSGFKGTLAYAGPEQLTSAFGEVDKRTDLYQMGVVVYEMLTGKLPFEGDKWASRLIEDPQPPSQVNPALPGELDRIVLKALARRKEERYRAAFQLGDELRRWIKQRPSPP